MICSCDLMKAWWSGDHDSLHCSLENEKKLHHNDKNERVDGALKLDILGSAKMEDGMVLTHAD